MGSLMGLHVVSAFCYAYRQENADCNEMNSDHPAIACCRRDLGVFQSRLDKMKNGTMKFGISPDGVTWSDTTADEIASAER